MDDFVVIFCLIVWEKNRKFWNFNFGYEYDMYLLNIEVIFFL